MKTISTVALRNTTMLAFIQRSVHWDIKRLPFEHIDQQIRLQKLVLLIKNFHQKIVLPTDTQGLNENRLF